MFIYISDGQKDLFEIKRTGDIFNIKIKDQLDRRQGAQYNVSTCIIMFNKVYKKFIYLR